MNRKSPSARRSGIDPASKTRLRAQSPGDIPNVDTILATLESLYSTPTPLEMRVITRSVLFGTVSGIYDAYQLLAQHGLKWNAAGHNVYITLNGTTLPVTNKCLARRWRTTRDRDVPSYRYLLLDLDPVRAPNTSSTAEEKSHAWKTVAEIREYLTRRAWPAPFVADSGNGFHLLYRVDLAVNPESVAILRNCLGALNSKFSNPDCKVDTTTFNPARIVKLYGTVTHKGEDTAERPHRRSRLILAEGHATEIVPTQLVFGLSAEAPSKATRFPSEEAAGEGAAEEKLAWLLGWLDAHAVRHSLPHKRDDGSWIIFVSCPWRDAHTIDSGMTEAAVFAMPRGFGFDCRHDHCADRQWSDYRRAVEGGMTYSP